MELPTYLQPTVKASSSCYQWFGNRVPFSGGRGPSSNSPISLQYRSSFQSSTLIGRAVTRSQTSVGVRIKGRLGFRAGYDVFRMYAVLISTNQIRALKITPG